MKTSHKYFKLLFFVLILSVAQYVQSASMVSDSIQVKYRFNPVVKTGTRVEGVQRDLAASISVIEASKISQVPSNAILDVVNSYVPGLYLTEWNVMGYGVAGSAAGKLSMRGIGGTADTHVMILRNGRPDFMGLMGCTIADEFATDGIERIEVLRGPASFLYGTNASAGVVNIVTKSQRDEGFHTHFKAGYGTFNSQKYSIYHSGKKGNSEYQLTASRQSTDGFREDTENSYEGNYFTGHFGQQINASTSIEFNASLADLYLFDPGYVAAPNQDDWYDILRWGGDLTLSHNSRFGDSYIKAHGNFGKHKFADGWRSQDQMLGAIFYHNIKLIDGNKTTIGFDIKTYGGHAEGSVDYTEENVTEYAPYIHMQQIIFKRLIGSAGFRLENHSLFGTVPIPKLGLVAHLSQANALRIDVSKGFRSPSIRELYFFPPHNENLKPDEIWNYEIGFSQQIGSSLQFDAVLFHNEGNNLIAMAKRVTGMGFQYTNIGQIENNGFELQMNWMPTDRVNIGGSWSNIDMKYTIPNVPEQKLTAFASWQMSKFRVSTTLIHVQDLVGKDAAAPVANIYSMDDYTIMNVSATYQLFRTMGIEIAIKNILDADYQAMYGYPMPGRHLLMDIKYDL